LPEKNRKGFVRVKAMCPTTQVAISFAFPGPANCPAGIIGDLGNLPCFRGGMALGPWLEEKFFIPVFINNDADFFTYGEAIAVFLPCVNTLLKNVGSPKRYHNLFGVMIGTIRSAPMKMISHHFITNDRKVEETVFTNGKKTSATSAISLLSLSRRRSKQKYTLCSKAAVRD
jgi:hypothetical protein